MTWLEETYNLLTSRNSLLSLKQIAEDTNLTFGWLNDFSRKRSKNPGITQVEHLYTYLKQKLEE